MGNPAASLTCGVAGLHPTPDSRPMTDTPLLEAHDLRKTFPPATRALDGVDLTLRGGEIHGLLGVNGAGKSTLIKIIAGIERPDTGTLRLEGREIDPPATPQAAHAAGIGVVHQELPLLPNLTAAENVALGLQSPRFLARARRRRIRAEYLRVSAMLSGAPSPDALLADLGPDRWQLVAVIRALASGARILVLDEPTSSLGQRERQDLHAALRDIAALGVAVLYVSHFLDDVLDVCDVVTVLRDARVALEARTAGMSTGEMLTAMTGEALSARSASRPRRAAAAKREQVLQLNDLAATGAGPISLAIHAGERVGLYGLQDCGARELLEATFGLRHYRGVCALAGQRLHGGPRERIDAGLGYMPPERSKALIGDWSLAANMTLPGLGAARSMTPLAPARERRAGAEVVERFGIVGRAAAPVGTLSGGNQQKVALAKWLVRETGCLLADEPTRGVDVRGRQMLHDLMIEYSDGGAGVLLFSTDPEEVIALCHRVHILERGRVTRTLEGEEITIEALERLGRLRASDEAVSV